MFGLGRLFFSSRIDDRDESGGYSCLIEEEFHVAAG